MIRFSLAWPSPALSPNARVHWAVKRKAQKTAFDEGYFEALLAMGGCSPFHGPVDATFTFSPPDKRRRDADNALASLKSQIDGISKAIGIDDSKWSVSARICEPAPPLGRVDVEISERSE